MAWRAFVQLNLGASCAQSGLAVPTHSHSSLCHIQLELLQCALHGNTLENCLQAVTGSNVVAWVIMIISQYNHTTLFLHELHQLIIGFWVQFKMMDIIYKALYDAGQGHFCITSLPLVLSILLDPIDVPACGALNHAEPSAGTEGYLLCCGTVCHSLAHIWMA